jgi:hypothetical protein
MLYNTTEESHAVEYVALVATTEEPPAKEQVAYRTDIKQLMITKYVILWR